MNAIGPKGANRRKKAATVDLLILDLVAQKKRLENRYSIGLQNGDEAAWLATSARCRVV